MNWTQHDSPERTAAPNDGLGSAGEDGPPPHADAGFILPRQWSLALSLLPYDDSAPHQINGVLHSRGWHWQLARPSQGLQAPGHAIRRPQAPASQHIGTSSLCSRESHRSAASAERSRSFVISLFRAPGSVPVRFSQIQNEIRLCYVTIRFPHTG